MMAATGPASKHELLERLDRERFSLVSVLERLPDDDRNAPVMADWSPKDLVAHLAAWERLFIGWWECAAGGEAPDVPAAGYTWRDEDRLNDDIHRAWQDASWQDVHARWAETSAAIRDVIDGIPEDELFAPAAGGWTGRSTVAGYAWECTGGHYAWAREGIEKSA